MHLYIDSADQSAITRCLPHPLIYGVTTNPTLMKRAGVGWSQLPDLVMQVLELEAQVVQVQVQSQGARDMLADARRYLAWAEPGRVVPKIPATREGLIAAAELSRDGVPVTLTGVFEVEQALWSAMVGAQYAAPYLGRLNDQGRNGLEVIRSMQDVIERSSIGTSLRLLVASIRSRQDVLDLLAVGVGAMTIPPTLFHELVDHEPTLAAERVFLEDANQLR
jgi:transaldolase